MIEDYVSYEQAVRLRELGFPQELSDQAHCYDADQKPMVFFAGFSVQRMPYIAAPTLLRALLFLAQAYGVHFEWLTPNTWVLFDRDNIGETTDTAGELLDAILGRLA